MRENGIPYKTSRRSHGGRGVGSRPDRHGKRGRRDRRDRKHEKRREALGRRRERDLRGHGRQSGRRLHGRRFHHGRRRAVRRRPAGRNPILDEPGQGHGQVKPAGPYRQRLVRLSGLPGRQEQLRRGSDDRLGRLLRGLRTQVHAYPRLGPVQIRLGQQPGGPASRPAAELAPEAPALRADRQQAEQQRPENEPFRGDHRRNPGRIHLPGHRHHAGRHVPVEPEARERGRIPRRLHAGHDRQSRQGDSAGRHPHHVQWPRRPDRRDVQDHCDQGRPGRMGDVHRRVHRHLDRDPIHVQERPGTRLHARQLHRRRHVHQGVQAYL